MPVEIPTDLKAELVPLAWLIGSWEGVGVVGYADTQDTQFGQRIDFVAPNAAPYLLYTAQSWLLDDQGTISDTLSVETGLWQIVRQRDDSDVGPGLIPPTEKSAYDTVEAIETLRNADGDFDLEVSLVHPHGLTELYAGRLAGPRIDLSTDVVARTRTAKDYTASTRMYGLVEGDLLWAWDMAAVGHELATHASARLKKVT